MCPCLSSLVCWPSVRSDMLHCYNNSHHEPRYQTFLSPRSTDRYSICLEALRQRPGSPGLCGTTCYILWTRESVSTVTDKRHHIPWNMWLNQFLQPFHWHSQNEYRIDDVVIDHRLWLGGGLFKTYKWYKRCVYSRSFQNTCVNLLQQGLNLSCVVCC